MEALEFKPNNFLQLPLKFYFFSICFNSQILTIDETRCKCLDAAEALEHIKYILQLCESHRNKPEQVTHKIIESAIVVAEKLFDRDMKTIPRIPGRYHNQSNHPTESFFWILENSFHNLIFKNYYYFLKSMLLKKTHHHSHYLNYNRHKF